MECETENIEERKRLVGTERIEKDRRKKNGERQRDRRYSLN